MKITVSSSCSFENEWPKLKEELGKFSVEIYIPEIVDIEGYGQSDLDRALETINREFYKNIDDCDILYVYCPGVYIGRGVASEIGYAIAKGKDVIASDVIEDIGIWSLVNKIKNVRELGVYIKEKYEF